MKLKKQTESKNDFLKIGLILCSITLVVALLLSIANEITYKTIENLSIKTAIAARQEVLVKAKEFVELKDFDSGIDIYDIDIENLKSIYVGEDENNHIVGYVITLTSTEGYGGEIELMAGINMDLKLEKIKILSMQETPGLGLKAGDAEFTDQFIDKTGGKNSPIICVKPGENKENSITAITSATITSRAVTNAVNNAIDAARYINEKLESDSSEGFSEIEDNSQKAISQNSAEVEVLAQDINIPTEPDSSFE